MAVFETWLKSDLKKPLTVKPLAGNLFSADNQGNLIGVEVMDGGSPAELSGGVTGYVIRADGATLPITGTLEGNRASIVLPASAYTVIGHVSIVIKVGSTTVGACTSYVYQTTTDAIVDPGRVIPSIEELLAQIEACIAATAGATAAAASANTAAANANAKAALAESAAANANTKAGLANTAASTANAAAGKIDNMTVAATGLPAGSAPVVTVTEVGGHKHLAFQIPKGDKGKDFRINYTFRSIAEMEAYSEEVEIPSYAMIDTGSVEDVDTGKLYCYESDREWHYIGDLSGAQGIKGETGTGIDHVSLNADYTLTIYYDDGTSTTTTSIRGATGITPNISIGSVTTLTPNQQAFVELDQTSTPEAPVFNFGIPKGDTGTIENLYASAIPMSQQDPTKVDAAINAKVSKVSSAVTGNFAAFNANGEIEDSGSKPSDFLKQHQDISGKADKVTGATNGNLAGLDTSGNLTDSGIAAGDVAAKEDVNSTQDGIAIVAVGDTHDAISSGQFVFVRSHPTLAKGMYKATEAIAANGALSTSNLTADGSGGLNDLQSQATNLQSQITSLNSKIANSVRVVITTGSTSVAKNGWSEINWASDDVLCLGTLYGASHDSHAFWFSSNPTSRKFNIYNSYSGTSSQTVSYMLAHFKLI